MLGYGVAGVIGLVVVVGIVVADRLRRRQAASGGDAHIDQTSGSTNGVQPDERSRDRRRRRSRSPT